MKKAVLLTVYFILYFNSLQAQQCFPFEAGLTCAEAPICCEVGLDGYYGVLPNPIGPLVNLNQCNITLHNPHYIKFIAGSVYLELLIEPSNCIGVAGPLYGLQAMITSECVDFNQPFFTDPANFIVGECSDNLNPFSLTAILEPGQTYYLILDGFTASICEYYIQELSGTTSVPYLDSEVPTLQGPDYILSDNQYTFSTDPIPFVANYDWQVTGGTILSGAGTTNIVVEVTDDANFEVCIQGANDCTQTETTCEAFVINPDLQIIEESICEGECYVLNNTAFCETGTYNVEVFNGTEIEYYRLILTVLSPTETNVSEIICEGTCYPIGGVDFCNTGTYAISLVSSQGCDSIVILDLIVLDENGPMVTINSGANLDCQNPTVILNTVTSIPVETYEWSGPGINANNINDPNPSVDLPGLYTVTVATGNGCIAVTTIEVTGQAGVPDITIQGNEPLGCNNDETNLTATTAIGGVDFQWSGPNGFSETGATIRVTIPGTYTLIATVLNGGCMDTIDVEVELSNDELLVDPGPNRHIQCEFVLTLDAPGVATGNNIAYQWTTLDGNILNGANTLNPRVNRNGTYTLVATDLVNGCSGSADMIVYADMAIITEDYLELTCTVSSLEIDGTESYSGADASIQWTTNTGNIVAGANTLMPTIDAPGVYQLVINRPGCLSFATVTVLDNTGAPDARIDADNDAIFCGEPVVLTAISSGNILSFEWLLDGNVISTEEVLIANDPGEYVLQVVNEYGCINADVYFLTEVQDPSAVTIGGDLTLDCTLNGAGTLSATVQGADPFYNYNWFALNDGEILSNTVTSSISISGGGTYCIEVFSTNSDCSILECVDVIEISDIILNPTVTDASCNNSADGSITLSLSGGSAPFAYEWSGKAGDNEDVTADAGADQTLDCLTDFLVLDGGASVFPPGTTFQWTTNDGTIDDGANTLFPSVTSTGTYVLRIISPEGCDDSDQITVTEYTANAGPSLTLTCNESTVQLQASDSQSGSSYDWINENGAVISDILNPEVNQEGVYTLIVTLANGCTYTDETTVGSNFETPDVSVVNEEVYLEFCGEPVWVQGQSNTAGVVYSWSGPSGTSNEANFSVELEGTYVLTVTGTNGCTNTAMVTVEDRTLPPLLRANPQTQYLNCFNGNPLLLNVTIETFTNDITIDWSVFAQVGNIVDEVGHSITDDLHSRSNVLVEYRRNNGYDYRFSSGKLRGNYHFCRKHL